MQCRKCRAQIPDESKFCLRCGAKQTVQQRTKSRGNGTGTVYQRPNKTWIAVKTISYTVGADGVKRRKTITKSGFKTKKEALEYLPYLVPSAEQSREISFEKLYEIWEPTHRAGKSTMDCYSAAYKWFRPIWLSNLSAITIDDLQACLDECPKGKRTKQNMKALAGLLYKFAIPRRYTDLNMAQYLVITADDAAERNALPMAAVSALMKRAGSLPYAPHIICQCYLGFRPSELLALRIEDYDPQLRAFTGGAKTDAGKDRVVTVSPKIQPFIDRQIGTRSEGAVFCSADGQPLSAASYRAAFYDTLDAIGLENPVEGEGDAARRRYTPHSCRHTFATLLKNVQAPDKDKLRLIGHTSAEMLRHYQDVDIEALRRITDAI